MSYDDDDDDDDDVSGEIQCNQAFKHKVNNMANTLQAYNKLQLANNVQKLITLVLSVCPKTKHFNLDIR